MTTKNYYDGIQHTVHISTNNIPPDERTTCEVCSREIGPFKVFAELVNHYINEHAYKLLHLGTETSNDLNGKPWHSTVAVLGK